VESEDEPAIKVPIEVVNRAWKKPDGTHTIMGHHVVKDKKMVVVSPPSIAAPIVNITVFPKPSHFETFRQARVKQWGPASYNPFAVGTLKLRQLENQKYVLEYAQSHFRTPEKPEQIPPKGANVGAGGRLSRGFATKYQGWRIRAFESMIRLAKKHNYDIIVPDRVYRTPEVKRSLLRLVSIGKGLTRDKETQLYRDLTDTCDRHGVDWEEIKEAGRPILRLKPGKPKPKTVKPRSKPKQKPRKK